MYLLPTPHLLLSNPRSSVFRKIFTKSNPGFIPGLLILSRVTFLDFYAMQLWAKIFSEPLKGLY